MDTLSTNKCICNSSFPWLPYRIAVELKKTNSSFWGVLKWYENTFAANLFVTYFTPMFHFSVPLENVRKVFREYKNVTLAWNALRFDIGTKIKWPMEVLVLFLEIMKFWISSWQLCQLYQYFIVSLGVFWKLASMLFENNFRDFFFNCLYPSSYCF